MTPEVLPTPRLGRLANGTQLKPAACGRRMPGDQVRHLEGPSERLERALGQGLMETADQARVGQGSFLVRAASEFECHLGSASDLPRHESAVLEEALELDESIVRRARVVTERRVADEPAGHPPRFAGVVIVGQHRQEEPAQAEVRILRLVGCSADIAHEPQDVLLRRDIAAGGVTGSQSQPRASDQRTALRRSLRVL
jgi:hypothetical protein